MCVCVSCCGMFCVPRVAACLQAVSNTQTCASVVWLGSHARRADPLLVLVLLFSTTDALTAAFPQTWQYQVLLQ